MSIIEKDCNSNAAVSSLDRLNQHLHGDLESSQNSCNAFLTPDNKVNHGTLADLFDEIRRLKTEVASLRHGRHGSACSSPARSDVSDFGGGVSPVVGVLEPIDLNVRYNNAAQTIILHSKTANEWQKADIEDSPIVLRRMQNDENYLLAANRRANISNVDGTFSNSYLSLFR
jgi:hypothetical protein